MNKWIEEMKSSQTTGVKKALFKMYFGQVFLNMCSEKLPLLGFSPIFDMVVKFLRSFLIFSTQLLFN
ncbi:hypothetical protein [Salinimicrobium oceani]|uniref:Uncharacterized protein n=1 Tax=Salinimicrobium oceani TaxID=2722702 RepID=A0ABX1D499_9FLAO|nr:hypothetical protein [Salinimicrobium oceani]NJW54167.1 hypothetical protein [Salinimicrobium oceani]